MGVGSLLFLGLILLATVLDLGERLGRVHWTVEAGFYGLALLACYGLLLHPILSMLRMSSHPLQRFLDGGQSTSPHAPISKKDCRRVATRLLRSGGLSPETAARLRATRAEGGLSAEAAIKEALQDKCGRAGQLVKDHARLAFVSTAVLQNGSLDALMLVYTNLKLVRALVAHFGYRPSLPALLMMYGQILAAALVAERIEDVQLEDIFPQLGASVGGGVMAAIPGISLVVHALLQGMGSAFLTLRTGYLAEEFILRGSEAFDRRRERKSATRRAARELVGVVLSTAAQLPASMRTLLRALNGFKEPASQP